MKTYQVSIWNFRKGLRGCRYVTVSVDERTYQALVDLRKQLWAKNPYGLMPSMAQTVHEYGPLRPHQENPQLWTLPQTDLSTKEHCS